MDYILLIVGFVLLVKGADIFVDGSSDIARYFSIPSFIIGLTIVAFGTSAPEAAVSITAATTGQNGIAVGNVIGSNLFNLLMVLGACALIKPCPVQPHILKSEYPLSIIAALLFIVLALTTLGSGESLYLSRPDGLILLAIFAFFIISTIRKAIKHPAPDSADHGKKPSLPKGIVFAVVGLAAVIFGGQLVVDKASAIAASFGISQTLIGLTIVAIGTSLPELVTSIAAARKGETDIAVGNVIGSNLFNILFVLGASVTVHPIRIESVSIYDAWILVAASLLVMAPAIAKKEIRRGWGILFILAYLAYSYYIIVR
ncbi:calcium/sodium antiporter [Anaerovorax odorimutans]|uniref:Calcium/sodium antiporter n=1 Tax=Anaerovorax odorimutans TaxID=109327 RepID=A0ABT1RRI8_9FIRM|nr:calcium/sodium antiporter [Anaerovorax odorimutans]MCQ4637764.1 calcium/sodium antiporter [Anaerovorax odorimutans]